MAPRVIVVGGGCKLSLTRYHSNGRDRMKLTDRLASQCLASVLPTQSTSTEATSCFWINRVSFESFFAQFVVVDSS